MNTIEIGEEDITEVLTKAKYKKAFGPNKLKIEIIKY